MRGAEDRCETIDDLVRSLAAALDKSSGERSSFSACETNQASGKLLDILQSGCAFGLGGFAHFEARDELTKILIANLRCAKQEQARRLMIMLVRKPGRRREHVAKRVD